MNWFGSNIVEQVGNAVDSTFTSDEERIELKNEMYKLRGNVEIAKEQEQTKRVISDNEHLVTRLVRPSLLIYMTILFTSLALTDGNIGEFTIKALYVNLIADVWLATVGGYFILREIGKHSKNKHGKN